MVVGITEISIISGSCRRHFAIKFSNCHQPCDKCSIGILSLVVKFLLGLEIAITWVAVLVCAIGGLFGALE